MEAMQLRPLDAAEQQAALKLFLREIDMVTAEGQAEGSAAQRFVEDWLIARGTTPVATTWLGVVDRGAVVAAAYAGPHYGQAADVLHQQLQGRDDAGEPEWIVRYTTRVAHFHDIAVAPGLRRQGVGTALVRQVTSALTARGVRSVTGFATNPASAALFKSCGYTLGKPGQAVPKEQAEGLRTLWHEELPSTSCYFWKSPGSAFGLS